MADLHILPITIKAAATYVALWHRHLPEVAGGLWALRAVVGDKTVGVAIVGRPTAQMTQANEPLTCEVNRCSTDGTEHACSALYAAATRTARAQGWRKIITYTLPTESGSSLKALREQGWRDEGLTEGGRGDRKNPRGDRQHGPKRRWVCDLVTANPEISPLLGCDAMPSPQLDLVERTGI